MKKITQTIFTFEKKDTDRFFNILNKNMIRISTLSELLEIPTEKLISIVNGYCDCSLSEYNKIMDFEEDYLK